MGITDRRLRLGSDMVTAGTGVTIITGTAGTLMVDMPTAVVDMVAEGMAGTTRNLGFTI